MGLPASLVAAWLRLAFGAGSTFFSRVNGQLHLKSKPGAATIVTAPSALI